MMKIFTFVWCKYKGKKEKQPIRTKVENNVNLLLYLLICGRIPDIRTMTSYPDKPDIRSIRIWNQSVALYSFPSLMEQSKQKLGQKT